MFYKLLNPGGRLIMATWCHRETPPVLHDSERKLLQKVYDLYHLPPMKSIDEIVTLINDTGFQEVKSADWSDAVAPFWKAVIQSIFKWKSFKGLMKAGWPTIKGAWAMRYMIQGYERGLIKFGVFQAKKI